MDKKKIFLRKNIFGVIILLFLKTERIFLNICILLGGVYFFFQENLEGLIFPEGSQKQKNVSQKVNFFLEENKKLRSWILRGKNQYKQYRRKIFFFLLFFFCRLASQEKL